MNRGRYLCFASLLLCVAWLIITFLQNEIPTDPGDGLTHFFISQASWFDHSLFLNHWGKPAFILFSSAFAQFGFGGMAAFNISVYVLTCLFAFKIFEKLGVSSLAAALFPILLLLPKDVPITVLGGLTEPLFNLCLMIGLYLLVDRKWLAFALVLSLVPFLRSEGQFVILVAFIVLLLHKQWKFIPFLGTAFLLYALAGLWVYGDFLWYFNKSAYSYENNIYGQGSWGHYLLSYKNYLGNFGLALFILAFLSFIYLLFKKRLAELRFSETFFAVAIFSGIVLIHSYLWANAKYGSLGLTRIATQGLPVFLVMCVYFGAYFIQRIKKTKLVTGFFTLALAFLVYILLGHPAWPLKADLLDKQVSLAGKYLKDHEDKFGTLYFHHPLIAYEMGLNPLIDKNKLKVFNKGTLLNAKREMKAGDVFAWDSHFGPREGGVKIAELEAHPDFSKIQAFTYYSVINEESGAVLFQYKAKKQAPQTQKEAFGLPIQKTVLNPGIEFAEITKIQKKGNYRFLDVFGNSTQAGIFLVCTSGNNEHYQAHELKQGADTVHFSLLPNTVYNLYYWNQYKTSATVRIDSAEMKRLIYRGL